MRELKLVLIEWHDSFGCSPTWADLKSIDDPKPMVCRSVGWLAFDGEDTKVIVPHVAEDGDGGQGCGDMTIPTSAIVRIVELPQMTETFGELVKRTVADSREVLDHLEAL